VVPTSQEGQRRGRRQAKGLQLMRFPYSNVRSPPE
jgi:hypothetical protein